MFQVDLHFNKKVQISLDKLKIEGLKQMLHVYTGSDQKNNNVSMMLKGITATASPLNPRN